MPTNTSFSSGFGAGTRLGDIRVGQERNQLFREQQQQQQQTELRARLDSGFESTIKQVQDSAKKFSAAILSAADDTKRQNLIDTYDKYTEEINASEEEKDAMAVNSQLLSSSEAQNRASRLRLSAVLTDPVAETKLGEQVKTQGAIDTAEGTLRSKKDLDRFQTDQDIRLKAAPSGAETVITGSPADFLTPTQKGKFASDRITAETTLKQNVFAIDELMGILDSPDFIGGNLGGMASSVNSLVAQVQAVTGTRPIIESEAFKNGKNLDLDQVDESISDENLSQLRKWAISDDLEESSSLNLAFILAKSLNNNGKISDADVVNAKKILGSSADPESRRAVLRSVQERMIRNYNIEQEILGRSIPGIGFEPLTLDSIRGFEGGDVSSTEDAMKELERLEAENKQLEADLNVGQ